MKRGYTKAWRKELESEIWRMLPIYHRVWFVLRQKAQYEEHLFPTPNKFGIWVVAGQRITSYQQIAEWCAWEEYGVEKVPNKKTIKKVLEWLEHKEMIAVESNAKGTLITIINWDIYNSAEGEKVTQRGTPTGLPTGLPTGHKKRRTKKVKEVKEEDQKIIYGETVLLSNKEYQSLLEKTFAGRKDLLDTYIEKVDDYSLSSGKKYTGHAAAIRTFYRRDSEQGRVPKGKTVTGADLADQLRESTKRIMGGR